MKKSFVLSPDGTKIRIGQSGKGNRNVLVVHGLAEHLDRYQYFAETLAQNGYNVTVVELRGHGESEGKRGHVRQWTQYCEDVATAAKTISGKFILFGHSTGGLTSLYMGLHGLSHPIIGLALSAPNVLDTVEAPVKKFFGHILSRIYPTVSFETGLITKHLSRDPQIVSDYEQSPLVYGTVTARFYTEMLKAQAKVVQAAPSGKLPVILQVGEDDKIVDPKSALQVMSTWQGETKIITYPNLYHEIFNEPEKDKVLADLMDWMNAIFERQ